MQIDPTRLDKLKQITARKTGDVSAALDAVHEAFRRLNDAQDRLAALRKPSFHRQSREEAAQEQVAIAAAERDLAAKQQAYRESEGAYEAAVEKRDAAKSLAASAVEYAGSTT